MQILHGDCLEVLRTLPDCSVDAVVTDPPYGLAFMGKRWDYDVPAVEVWAECLRVLKPGGHLLAFAGTRTQHRMAVRIEDAGFEIRDLIAWVYGSGFPKSLDVSKAIDKRGGNSHLTAEIGAAIKAARVARGVSIKDADAKYCGSSTLWTWFEGRPAGQQMPTASVMAAIAADWPELQQYAEAIAEADREVVAAVKASRLAVAPGQGNDRSGCELAITAAATDAACQWAGWGTALKPALEPITVARKPLIGTVAENVLAWGTGGLNIDGCRVGAPDGVPLFGNERRDSVSTYASGLGCDNRTGEISTAGRWPANLIHDGSEEVLAGFGNHSEIPNSSPARFFYCAKASKRDRDEGLCHIDAKLRGLREDERFNSGGRTLVNGSWVETHSQPQAKRNHHPTVKPTDLMRYLCRLVTPPGGIVLDPFMGSGSTGKACALEGFGFIGIEREAEYVEIARARIAAAQTNREPEQRDLLEDAA